MPPTQPLPDTPAPSHLIETHNMGSDTQPTAPQMPSCEKCGEPAQLQCGICKELFFCDTPTCFEVFHSSLRACDRETHRASVTSYGTSSKCAQHPGQELCLVCVDPACGDALICMRCDKCDTHAGYRTVDITDYMKRQRDTFRSHVADLTAQRTAAEEKCRVLEALPPTEDTYKDLLLQTRVGHLVMREDVSRREVVCEEELARNFLTQALSREGEVCALKTFVAKAGRVIAECEAVCQLGDDQVLRAVTESQAVVRSINSMAASGDRHRLVGAAGPHAPFSFPLKLPVSNVHDALAQRSALAVQVSVNDAIAALRALGETTLTAERFEQVTHQRSDPKLACLLLQAGAATAIPDKFFTQRHVTCIDISYAPALVVIGDKFLWGCTSLTTVNLSGLQGVTSIGQWFLSGCTSLSTVDLSGLQGVTSIGKGFLGGCTSLSTVDLRGLQGVTSIGNAFLGECTSLSTVDLSGLQGVTSIGQWFLGGCTSLSTVDLRALQGVASIGQWFLSGCTSLSTVDLSGLQGVTSIGEGFLGGCTSLSTLDLSGLQGVTSIGNAFLGECTSLSTVDLSGLQGVTSIGQWFLGKCTSLSTVDLRGLQGVTSIGGSFLAGCPALKTLHGKDTCSNAVLSSLPDHLRN